MHIFLGMISGLKCDAEIIKGVADRIRNPVVVIGGNVSRLMKNVDIKDPVYPVYNFIFEQSKKCDRMVRDIKTYMEVYEKEPLFEPISIDGLLNEALEGFFAHLLENSLEALQEKNPLIRISSKLECASPHSLNIVIFNTGIPIRE